MTLLLTDAIVLHAIDYLESSRILRVVTREAGVQSVLARGARSSRKRFGSAVDLFAEGQAQLQMKPGRDLHALVSFDVQRAHPGIGTDLARFTAAAALAECVLHLVHDEASTAVYDTISDAVSRIAGSGPRDVAGETLGALWRIVADIGIAPATEICAACHVALDPAVDAMFSHQLGGALCARCAERARGGRRLPAAARRAISGWLAGTAVAPGSAVTVQSHQRLLREFLVHHMADARPLKAWPVWERGGWDLPDPDKPLL